jgi:hypothetical protein
MGWQSKVPLDRRMIRIDPDTWQTFCRVADRKGMPAAVLLRAVIDEFLGEQLSCRVEA